jgi:hypothetical protein
VVFGARPVNASATAPALEPVEDEGEAVTVFAPAQFVRLDEIE